MDSRTVIVGGSVGGIRVAQALRSQGYTGEVTVIDAETYHPYDKPPLSKSFLDGTLSYDRLYLISEEEVRDSAIDLRLGDRVVGLDITGSSVILESGPAITFENLVVATGLRARPSPWEATDGVHLLRTLDNAQLLKEDLLGAGSVVVVGGGFIGAEVAATARSFGLEVAIVDPLKIPIGRVLGDTVGERFTGLHHSNGVSTHFGTRVERITGAKGNLSVELSSGAVLLGDLVVVGIGAVPNTEWLVSSGLLIDNGLICDEYCRAAGQSNIYGVGDVARWYHPGYQALVRVEHWTNAVEQAACVAHNIINPKESDSYSPVSYVWSDQYDWKIQIAGETAAASDCVLVEDPSNHARFAAVYSNRSGSYCGVATVNWPRAMIQCRRLLDKESDISIPLNLITALLPSV